MNDNVGQPSSGTGSGSSSYPAYPPASKALDYYGYLPAQHDRPLREYTAIIFQHRWKIILCTIVGVLLASWINERSPRIYSTKALVSVGAYIPPMPGEISDVLRQQTGSAGYTNSLLPILGSYSIANYALAHNKTLRTFLNPDYQDAPVNKDSGEESPPDFPIWMLDGYLGMVSSSYVDNSNMLRITSFARDPKIAAEAANAQASAFIHMVQEQRKIAAAVNEKFLRNKVEETKALSAEKEKQLAQFVDEHSMKGVVNGELPPEFNAERFRGIVVAIAEAAQQRAGLEGELRQLEDNSSMRNVRVTEGMESTYLKLIGLQNEYSLIKKQNPNFYNLRTMKGEIDSLQKIIKDANERDLNQRRFAVKASYERERLLTGQLEALKKTEAKEASDRINYLLLKQQKDAADVAFDLAKKRLDDALVNIENDQSNVRMIDSAVTPDWPISPNTRSNLTAGLFAGAVFGVALAFLLDFLNNAICSVTELQRATRCMTIGIIPIFARRRKAKKKAETPVEAKEPGGAVGADGKTEGLAGTTVQEANRARESVEKLAKAATVRPGQTTQHDHHLLKAGLSAKDFEKLSKAKNVHNIVCIRDPLSQEAESFRNIRTTLRHANQDNKAQLILVTSGRKGDGKTTIAANLAASIAQASARTLLIDADLRLPNVHKYFGLAREDVGLVDYLVGEKELKDIVRETEIPNLSIITAGSATPIPSELLETQLMSELLEVMKQHFDHIIIDSPPIAHVTDPLLLASQVSGVLLVARSGVTPTPVVEYAVQRLHQLNATIFGCVLNGVCRTNSYREAEYYFVAKKYQ